MSEPQDRRDPVEDDDTDERRTASGRATLYERDEGAHAEYLDDTESMEQVRRRGDTPADRADESETAER